MCELIQSQVSDSLLALPLAPAEDGSWFAVQTRPRHEKKVAASLQDNHIHSFLPIHSVLHTWSDRRKKVEVPLFPGYVFAQIECDLDHRIRVLRTHGVVGFVGVRGMGTPIPEEQIRAIQSVVAKGIPFGPHPYLTVGKQVRIVGGSLDGIRGIVVSKNDDASLVISVELIRRSIAIRVTGYCVQPI